MKKKNPKEIYNRIIHWIKHFGGLDGETVRALIMACPPELVVDEMMAILSALEKKDLTWNVVFEGFKKEKPYFKNYLDYIVRGHNSAANQNLHKDWLARFISMPEISKIVTKHTILIAQKAA